MEPLLEILFARFCFFFNLLIGNANTFSSAGAQGTDGFHIILNF